MYEPFGIEIVGTGEPSVDKGLQLEPVESEAEPETSFVSNGTYVQGSIQSGTDDFQFGVQIVDLPERLLFESLEQKVILSGGEMEHGERIKKITEESFGDVKIDSTPAFRRV